MEGLKSQMVAIIAVLFFGLWILANIRKLMFDQYAIDPTETSSKIPHGEPFIVVTPKKNTPAPAKMEIIQEKSPELELCARDGEAVFNQHRTGTTFMSCFGWLVMVQSAFCDPSGECTITGTTATRNESISVMLRRTKIQTCRGHVLRTTKKKVEYEWRPHGSDYAAFWLSFRVLPADIHHLEAPLFTRSRLYLNFQCFSGQNNNFGSHSTNEPRLHPVWVRRRAFVDKTVLIVTQWYSTVELSWIRAYFQYYFSIGADFVAIYTAFDRMKETNYTRSLQAIIDSFNGRILWFDWYEQDQLVDTWAHSQMSTVFHGANVFWGSTITIMDLDEIVYFVGEHDLKSISKKLNIQYGNWIFHFKPYFLPDDVADQMLKEACTLNFEAIYKGSEVHVSADKTKEPNTVQAKYIFHSLESIRLRTHVVDALTNQTHAGLWIDDSIAVMLHIRRLVERNFHGAFGTKKASCNAYTLRLRQR